MLPFIHHCWCLAVFLLSPEDSASGEERARRPLPVAEATAGLAKALFWTGVAVALGLALARLR